MNRSCIIVWSLLVLLLASQLPIFVQQTLTPDTVLYDIQAQCLLNGGVLYRDVLEPNLPGIVWVHAVVRSVIGWNSPALLIFDLLVVLSIGLLLGRLAASVAVNKHQRRTIEGTTLLGAMLFYIGTSEWCHCQRDTWMLLPCLMALNIRIHTLRRLIDAHEAAAALSKRRLVWSVLEGVLWAAGFWLKPFVAIPAMAVLFVSLRYSSSVRVWSLQTMAILSGGLLTGVVGVLWMIQSGCWPYFWDMVAHWNGDYFQAGRSRWTWERFVLHAMRFQPWILLHVVALTVSAKTLVSRQHSADACRQSSDNIVASLLAALYVGWIVQAFLLQQLFDYVHVPGVLLAWTICIMSAFRFLASGESQSASTSAPQPVPNIRIQKEKLICAAFIAFVFLVIAYAPTLRWHRQRMWLTCVQACFGNSLTPESRDQIAQMPFPRWSELQPMLDHLRRIDVTDQSLMAYNGNLIHLYPEFGFRPATRFVYLDVLARSFPGRRAMMMTTIEQSAIRYVVSDLREDGWEGDISDDILLPPSLAARQSELCFPYNQTPLFRSGGYILFRIDHPVARLSAGYVPLAK